MSAPVGLVVNPKSHAVQRKGSVLEAASAGIPDAHLVRAENFAALGDQIAGLARHGVRSIFIEGGDGTLHAVLTACFASQKRFSGVPEIAVLPGGSTNLTYKVCGLRAKTPEQVADYIARYRHDGASVARTHQSALRVETGELAGPAIGMLLSTGSLARVMLYTQRELHGEGARGSRAVAAAAAQFFWSPHQQYDEDGLPVLCSSRLVASSRAFRIQGDHTLSLMTPLPSLSLRLRPFWGKAAGQIAFTHAQWPIRGLRTAFLKVITGWTGAQMERHGLTSYRTDQIDLTYAGPLMLDGEILPVPADGRIRVSVTSPIRFLR
ncbi:MAG: diacylglycerol kinase family protein [Hyphomonas sp.]